jgi:hypothetical protein
MTDATASLRQLGRTTGILYLILVVFGMFSPIVLESLVVPGDAAATAANILGSTGLFAASLVSWIVIVVVDVAVSVLLYLLLEPVSRTFSLMAAAFRFAYSVVLGAFLLSLFDGFLLLIDSGLAPGPGAAALQTQALAHLETFSNGFVLALVLFGVHLTALGVLLKRSSYMPTALGVLLAVAGAGYVVNSLATFFVPEHGGLASNLLLMPALLGEVGLTVWLLVKGVSPPPVVTRAPHL